MIFGTMEHRHWMSFSIFQIPLPCNPCMQHPNKYLKDNLHPVKDCHPIFDIKLIKWTWNTPLSPSQRHAKSEAMGGRGRLKPPWGFNIPETGASSGPLRVGERENPKCTKRTKYISMWCILVYSLNLWWNWWHLNMLTQKIQIHLAAA